MSAVPTILRSPFAALVWASTTRTAGSSPTKRPRVAVALSGGVDSAASLLLLRYARELLYPLLVVSRRAGLKLTRSNDDAAACVASAHPLHDVAVEYAALRTDWKARLALALSAESDRWSSPFDVTAVHMSNWRHCGGDDDGDGTPRGLSERPRAVIRPCADVDRLDAAAIAAKLQVPFHHVDFSEAYWHKCFCPMLHHMQAHDGAPLNVDVLCNSEIKFALLREYCAANLGADFLVTGHYAHTLLPGIVSVSKDCNNNWKAFVPTLRAEASVSSPPLLCTPRTWTQRSDAKNDQTHFLHRVPPLNWHGVLFPLGECVATKSETRALVAAHPATAALAAKPTSTGLCFASHPKKEPPRTTNNNDSTPRGDAANPAALCRAADVVEAVRRAAAVSFQDLAWEAIASLHPIDDGRCRHAEEPPAAATPTVDGVTVAVVGPGGPPLKLWCCDDRGNPTAQVAVEEASEANGGDDDRRNGPLLGKTDGMRRIAPSGNQCPVHPDDDGESLVVVARPPLGKRTVALKQSAAMYVRGQRLVLFTRQARAGSLVVPSDRDVLATSKKRKKTHQRFAWVQEAWYVFRKDVASNAVWLCRGCWNHPLLLHGVGFPIAAANCDDAAASKRRLGAPSFSLRLRDVVLRMAEPTSSPPLALLVDEGGRRPPRLINCLVCCRHHQAPLTATLCLPAETFPSEEAARQIGASMSPGRREWTVRCAAGRVEFNQTAAECHLLRAPVAGQAAVVYLPLPQVVSFGGAAVIPAAAAAAAAANKSDSESVACSIFSPAMCRVVVEGSLPNVCIGGGWIDC